MWYYACFKDRMCDITPVSEIGCERLETGEAVPAIDDTMYPLGYPVYYNCTKEGFVFPGGLTELTITCLSDSQWDYAIPLSGCDGKSNGCNGAFSCYHGRGPVPRIGY